MNSITFYAHLGNITTEQVVSMDAGLIMKRISTSDTATEFDGGFGYSLSNESTWARFDLPPFSSGNSIQISQFLTGGNYQVSGIYSDGWGGGVAPQEGMQVFSPKISPIPVPMLMEPDGYAFHDGLAVFMKLTGSSISLTYENLMGNEGANSAVLSVLPVRDEYYEVTGHRVEVFCSCQATPGSNLTLLIAVGHAPFIRQPQLPPSTENFWTNFRACKELPS